MRPDVLVLAAFDPELAPLRVLLGEGLAANIAGRTICARAAGIGLPASAVGAAMHIAELQPQAVVLIGTCGAFEGAGLAIGDVVVARRLLLVDLAGIDGVSQFPAPMTGHLEASPAISATLSAYAAAGASSASVAACVATTLGITVDDRAAARIARATHADVEHLETYGVAAACAARGVPFAAVLGVANAVGARGRVEWLAHHGEAEAAVGERVSRWLRETE